MLLFKAVSDCCLDTWSSSGGQYCVGAYPETQSNGELLYLFIYLFIYTERISAQRLKLSHEVIY